MKLLITDDQKSVHMFFDRIIPYERLGITEVFHAKNGQEALELVQKEWPELIILDIRMPVMDGLAFLECLDIFEWEHRVLILSAYNEFEYARKCMVYGVKSYLLKPIDTKEVIQVLEKNMKELAALKQKRLEESLSDFFKTGTENPQEVPAGLDKKKYGVVCFKSEDNPAFEEREEIKVVSITVQEIVIWVFKMDSIEQWKTFFEEQWQRNGDITIGFSGLHDSRNEFYKAVMESIEALRQGFYKPGIYFYRPGILIPYQAKETEKLSEQLNKSYESGDVQEMKRAVEKLFFIFQRANVHPNYVQEFCYGFLIQLNPDFMGTLQTLKGNSFTDEFSFIDAAGLKNTFLRLMISMRLEIAPEEVQTDEDVVKRIRTYIDTNYEKDLSLATLAKHFFISKYQISRLFKKQFGTNYSEYILKVRMEAAAMLLQNSKEKMEEIARRSGFEETSYFSRVFSKYYGISPGEFRKKR